jgi:hypothetical protein
VLRPDHQVGPPADGPRDYRFFEELVDHRVHQATGGACVGVVLIAPERAEGALEGSLLMEPKDLLLCLRVG